MWQFLIPKNLRSFKKVLKAALFLGAGSAFVLAAIYVAVGQSLLGNPDYNQIDFYVFALTIGQAFLWSIYFGLRRFDISQGAMILFSAAYFLGSGWEDFFVYLIDMNSQMTGHLPHLDVPHWIGYWSTEVLWFDQVTGVAVYATMITTFFLIWLPGMWVLYKIDSNFAPI